MATADPVPELASTPTRVATDLLVMVTAATPEQFEAILANLASSFPPESLLIANRGSFTAKEYPALRIVSAPPANAGALSLAAAEFADAYRLAQENEARAILILGPGSDSLVSTALRGLAGAVLDASADLAVPFYALPPHRGMINSAVLHPLTRTLFASPVRFPLAIDLGLSPRMLQRLAAAAQRFSAADQGEAVLWPVNEAAIAGFAVEEFNTGPRALPQPAEPDINAVLAHVTGSLFADIEAKAAFWQRARRLPPLRHANSEQPLPEAASDVTQMVESFRFAYSNLLEIWTLILPPYSLVGLKRLSLMSAAEFRMPDSLWARIVFDFLVAYRLRTINRGHLLGAFIPLYLAWVASHINVTAAGAGAESHIEAVAAAFEADKPYLVARWRWPDRFNA